MNPSPKQLGIGAGAFIGIALFAGIVWMSRGGRGGSLFGGGTSDAPADGIVLGGAPVAVGGSADTDAGTIQAIAKGTREYANQQYGFSFSYPDRLTRGSFKEGEATQMILVQNKSNASAREGFQIAITPLDADLVVTPEQIKKDIPDQTVENPKEITIGGAVAALSFDSTSPSFGTTREVWFVRDRTLYQITAYREFADVLSDVLDTWKFR